MKDNVNVCFVYKSLIILFVSLSSVETNWLKNIPQIVLAWLITDLYNVCHTQQPKCNVQVINCQQPIQTDTTGKSKKPSSETFSEKKEEKQKLKL